MPLLLVAVPLQKSWLGLSYWRTPTIMELPVELEYIPYQEFQDRFSKLNRIVRPIYPTIWPNILMVSIFATMIVIASVGMARNVNGLAVMGQVACFVIPILAILWIRIRKESKARARKQFKRRSIKLLREWTEQDTPTFAIQWKLRLRVWNDVRRRREAAAAVAASGGAEQAQEQEQEQEVDLVPQQQGQQRQSSVTIQIESLDINNETSRNTANGVETASTDTPTTSIQPPPPRVADVYTALGLPTPADYISNNSTTSLPSPPPPTATTTPSRSRMITSPQEQRPHHQPTPTNNDNTQLTSDPTLFETRQSWIERLRDLSSRVLFTETRVWMIEISRRDNGVMDEYALAVPSPVYCGYRLPGYEDVLLQGTGGSGVTGETGREVEGGGGNEEMVIAIGVSPSTTTVINSNNAQQQQHMRYGGPPPAYFSDSEGEDDDDDDEDEEEGGQQQQSTSTSSTTAITGPRDLTRVVTLSGAHQPQHQRPMEMTAVALTSGPTSSFATSSTIARDRITGRLGNHPLRQQQGSTMSGITMTGSSSTSTYSATTSRTTLALTLADKDKEDENRAGGEGEGDDEDRNNATMDKEETK
ncbi:MAG: hypothetical protein J3R72DRAFT_518906 [Linnemannia gamsii]|nr:MAG: hypothetical protein J3R72DRAFT_518906 [Linnemannia gamsii]